jgi:hypothetical protein
VTFSVDNNTNQIEPLRREIIEVILEVAMELSYARVEVAKYTPRSAKGSFRSGA